MKLFKKIFIITTFLLLIFYGSIQVTFAWTPPKITVPYEEPVEEFRAVWVCTVSNMDMPKLTGTDTESINKWKNHYLTVLENSKEQGINTIIFQVRPCNDAFYPSKYNPWSANLLGLGKDPGFDPLKWMIEVTHNAGLDYHAWLNPYRTSVDSLTYSFSKADSVTGISYIYDYDSYELNNYKDSYFQKLYNEAKANNGLVDNPIFTSGPSLHHEVVLGTEGKFVLNPASPKTIEHLNKTIEELVTNYDLDGIHFDDYFYPDDKLFKGTTKELVGKDFSSEPLVDISDYNSYKENGGTLSLYNWRRQNVTSLIEELSNTIRRINKTKLIPCAFGISPSSNWAPSIESCPASSPRAAEGGINDSCNNYYSYSDLYADTYNWAKNEIIDYIVPQNYTNLGNATNLMPDGRYNAICSWWSNALKDSKTKLYMGTPVYQITNWTNQKKTDKFELFYQIRWNQQQKYRVDGYVYFRYESMLSGIGGDSSKHVAKYLWKNFALTPTYEGYNYQSVNDYGKGKELKKNADGSYTFSIEHVDNAKAYALYEGDVLISRVSSDTNTITFNKQSSNFIELYTYGYDNKMYKDYDVINLNDAFVNQAPTIIDESNLSSEYNISSNIDLEFSVNDKENDDLNYRLSLITPHRNDLLASGSILNNVINYTYTTYSVETNDLQFELVVSDGENETLYTTSKFNIVEIKEIVKPTINYFTEFDKTIDSITIAYNYKDQDQIVDNAYILLNDVKHEINKTKDNIVFANLDFENNDYIIKLVLEFNDEILESEELVYKHTQTTDPSQPDEPDNPDQPDQPDEPDQPDNPVHPDEPIKPKKKCGKKTITIVSILSSLSLIVLLLKKKES